MGHAAGGSSAQCKADLHAPQVMDDALDPALEQFALIRLEFASARFKVAGGQLKKPGRVGWRRRIGAQDPNNARLGAQVWRGALQSLELLGRGGHVLRLNAQKDDIRIAQQAMQILGRMVRTEIEEQSAMGGPLLQLLFDLARCKE